MEKFLKYFLTKECKNNLSVPITSHMYQNMLEYFTFMLSIWNLPTILVIIFWDFSMFYQMFLSTQVKQNVIISIKHGIYDLPQELPNDSRLRIIGNIREISNLHRSQVPNLPHILKILSILAKRSLKIEIEPCAIWHEN